ncbi:flavin monoamine oxidase family protein [Solimicrobium silvestre]|uniref:Tryptophan 2-monooxygenase n=1 Tax=Solimicrobium silvestre TaxID=2099400 RepID=A0A2S9GTB0_9BURK|nr:NAD(P)/FAD-dependent oxidoreductase [Solimicrobium silvestre]PRC90936.1 Tat (twin-arginine translocation) pathway signal sequence [Solimicrobium silvestre]
MKKNPKSPQHATENTSTNPVDTPSETKGISRRQVLRTGAAAAVTLAVGWSNSSNAAKANTAPRIVIVGAGLAGLRCAHSLWNRTKPIASTIYDADTSHLGGRCWSLRGFFDNGLIAEQGGTFISTTDSNILALAQSLGLQTETVNGGALPKGQFVAWVNNSTYSENAQQNDWNNLAWPAFKASYALTGPTSSYNNYTPEAFRLDNMSCLDYLTEIGLDPNSRLGQLIQTIQVGGGGTAADSSALSMIQWLGNDQTFDGGGFDEALHIKGGNDQIISGMISQLPANSIKQGYQLTALCKNNDGSYNCTFNNNGNSSNVTADHVVLALPFSTLRLVNLTGAGLSTLKLTAINQQGMGQGSKITSQFSTKTWPALNYNGVTNTGPSGYQTAWDESVPLGPKGHPALMVTFPADSSLTGAVRGATPSADINWFLAQIENVYPGTTAAYSGKSYESRWALSPWQRGTYHYYRVGQMTLFAGYEAAQEGNIHFAGEHTVIYDSTMQSAVLSGERAAAEVAAQI